MRTGRAVSKNWHCELNPDPLHDDCSHEQEAYDDDEVGERGRGRGGGVKTTGWVGRGGPLEEACRRRGGRVASNPNPSRDGGLTHSFIEVFKHSNIQMFENVQTLKHSNIQTFKNSNIPNRWISNIQFQSSNIQTFEDT